MNFFDAATLQARLVPVIVGFFWMSILPLDRLYEIEP
jgi:hypothetical protein